MTITHESTGAVGVLEEKARLRNRFDPDQPRDRKGRWIETGALVSIWGGGKGTVAKNLGGGRLEVHTEDGRKIAIHRNYLTVEQRPDGGKPSGRPGDRPRPIRASKPSTGVQDFTPSQQDTRVPVSELKPGQIAFVYGHDEFNAGTYRIGRVASVSEAGPPEDADTKPGRGFAVTFRDDTNYHDTIFTNDDAVARVVPDEDFNRLAEAENSGDQEAARRLALDIYERIRADDNHEADGGPTPDAALAGAVRDGERVRLSNGAEGTVAGSRDDGALVVELDSGSRVNVNATAVTPINDGRAPKNDVPSAGGGEAATRGEVMRSLKAAGDAIKAGDADAAERHAQRAAELMDAVTYSRSQRSMLDRRRDALLADAAKLRADSERPDQVDAPAAPRTLTPGDLQPGDKVTFDVPVTAANAARFQTPDAKRPPEPGDIVTVRGTVDGPPDEDMFGGYTVRLARDGARWESAGGGIGQLPRDGLEFPLEDGHAVHRVGRGDGARRGGSVQQEQGVQHGLSLEPDRAGTAELFDPYATSNEQPTPDVSTRPVEERAEAGNAPSLDAAPAGPSPDERPAPPEGQVYADQVQIGDTVAVTPPSTAGMSRRLGPRGTYVMAGGPARTTPGEPVTRTVVSVTREDGRVKLGLDDGSTHAVAVEELLTRGDPAEVLDGSGARVGEWVSANIPQAGDTVGFPAGGPTLPSSVDPGRYGFSRYEKVTLRGRIVRRQPNAAAGQLDDVTVTREDGTVIPVEGPVWASWPQRVVRFDPGSEQRPAAAPEVTPAGLREGDRLNGVDGIIDDTSQAADAVATPGGDVSFVRVRRDDDSREMVGLPDGEPVALDTTVREQTRLDETAPDALAVGDWFLDDDGRPLRVVSAPVVEGDRVRFDAAPDGGSAAEIDIDRGMVVTRVTAPAGLVPDTIPDVPALPVEPARVAVADLPDGAVAGRVRLRTDQRQRILDLDLDAVGAAVDEQVAQAAARLRARQVLSDDQIRALSQHLRTLAADESVPGARRRSHQRAAAWLDASHARLSGFPEPPHEPGRDRPEKSYARNLTMGDVIALPGTDGQASFGTITAVRPIRGFGLVGAHVRRDDGTVEEWVLPDGVDLWVMPDLPKDRPLPDDRPTLREGARLAQVEADRVDAAAARQHAAALADLESGTYRAASSDAVAAVRGLDADATREEAVAAARAAIDSAADTADRAADDVAGLLGARDDQHQAELADRVRPVTAAVRRRAVDNLAEAVAAADRLPGETWPDAVARVAAEYRDRPPAPGIETAGRALARLSERLRRDNAHPEPERRPLPEDADLAARMTDYRSQLPPDLADLGKQQVERSVFEPASLADLEAGRVPKVSATRLWDDDVADDDGPGEAAMRHLSVLRAAGRDLHDRFQQHMGGRETVIQAELDEVKRRRGDAWQAAAHADDLVVDARRRDDGAALPDLAARRDAAAQQWQTLAARHAELEGMLGAARRDALAATLAEIRPVGGDGIPYVDRAGKPLSGRAGSNAAALQYVEQVLPSDWLAAAREAGPVEVVTGPARHIRNGDRIRISLPPEQAAETVVWDGRQVAVPLPSAQPGGVPKAGVAAHELGHHLEQTVPGLREAERLLLWDRTSSGEIGDRHRPDPIVGMDRDEPFVAYPGDFPTGYTGRVYRDGDAYEVWPTVLESLAGGRDNADDDLREWGLGVLAMLGTGQDGPTGGTPTPPTAARDVLDGVDLSSLPAHRLADLETRIADPDAARRIRAEREARQRVPDGWDPAEASDDELLKVMSDRWALYGEDEETTALLDRVTAELDARDAERGRDTTGDLSASDLATMDSDDLAGVLERNWSRYDTDASTTAMLDQIMAELDARDADRRTREASQPDPLASIDVKSMPDGDLHDLWLAHKDHYHGNPASRDLVDRIFAELDDRDRRSAESSAGHRVQAPEEAQLDDLLTRGWSYRDAYAEVYGVDAEQLRLDEQRAIIDANRAPGERREQVVRRMYREWANEQYLRAEKDINGGVLLSRAGQAAGIDPASLWGGPKARANKYASEELKRWWAEQSDGGRMTYEEWRAQWLGSRQDQQRARERRRSSTGRDFGL